MKPGPGEEGHFTAIAKPTVQFYLKAHAYFFSQAYV